MDSKAYSGLDLDILVAPQRQLKCKRNHHCSPSRSLYSGAISIHTEERRIRSHIQMNSAPCPWTADVQLSEERSKDRNRSEMI